MSSNSFNRTLRTKISNCYQDIEDAKRSYIPRTHDECYEELTLGFLSLDQDLKGYRLNFYLNIKIRQKARSLAILDLNFRWDASCYWASCVLACFLWAATFRLKRIAPGKKKKEKG